MPPVSYTHLDVYKRQLLTIARLGLPVAVDGWLCLAENMPDGMAQRPGDVVTMADGSTCEIINTDAEGRLALADGLVLASAEAPDALVDIATLTGASVVALGRSLIHISVCISVSAGAVGGRGRA